MTYKNAQLRENLKINKEMKQAYWKITKKQGAGQMLGYAMGWQPEMSIFPPSAAKGHGQK